MPLTDSIAAPYGPCMVNKMYVEYAGGVTTPKDDDALHHAGASIINRYNLCTRIFLHTIYACMRLYNKSAIHRSIILGDVAAEAVSGGPLCITDS